MKWLPNLWGHLNSFLSAEEEVFASNLMHSPAVAQSKNQIYIHITYVIYTSINKKLEKNIFRKIFDNLGDI